MYCIHCGRRIPDNATFCQFCGSNQSGNGQVPVRQSGTMVSGIEEVSLYRISSIVCSILIIILTFFKLIKLEIYFGKGKLTILDFCSDIIAWSEKNLIEGPWGLMVFLVVTVGLVLIITPLIYLVQEFNAKGYDCNSNHIDTGYYMMNTIIGFLIFFIIVVFCVSALLNDSDSFIQGIGVTASTYAILGIAILNRLLFLPKYNELYFKKARASGKEPDKSTETINNYSNEDLRKNLNEKAIPTPEDDIYNYGPKKMRHDKPSYFEEKKKLSPTQWQCRKCGAINQDYVGTCKCGNNRNDNKY